jgi:hypothetical protein
MNGTAVRPAWKVFGILVVTLAAIGFAPPAHAQGPASGGTSLMSDRDVASFPAKPGEGKLTVALLLLALIGTTAVAANSSNRSGGVRPSGSICRCRTPAMPMPSLRRGALPRVTQKACRSSLDNHIPGHVLRTGRRPPVPCAYQGGHRPPNCFAQRITPAPEAARSA